MVNGMRNMVLEHEVTRTDRCMVFTRHGVNHRIDGPAIFTDHGSFTYYQYGEKHRLCGIALKYDNITRCFRRGYIVYES
jgi:hypothetical protein